MYYPVCPLFYISEKLDLEVDKLTGIFYIALFLSVSNPIDGFYFLFFSIALQRMRFWVN